MSNSKATLKKEEPKIGFSIIADVEKKTVIEEKEIIVSGFKGIEKIYYKNFNIFELSQATEDQPVYKSEINIAGKVFDIFIKYNIGRRGVAPFHLIIESEGRRNSLGFYNETNMAFNKVKIVVANNLI